MNTFMVLLIVSGTGLAGIVLSALALTLMGYALRALTYLLNDVREFDELFAEALKELIAITESITRFELPAAPPEDVVQKPA